MHYWATPGVDLHLVTHPESIAEVREHRRARRRGVSACTASRCRSSSNRARPSTRARALGLPEPGQDRCSSPAAAGASATSRAPCARRCAVAEVDSVVCLCGRNEELRARMLERASPATARVRVEGFTEEMPDWLAAADALVHSTGGLTVLEAMMRGCPAISYGWGRGHVRVNNRAFRRFGLAEVVAEPGGSSGRRSRAALARRANAPSTSRAALRRLVRPRRAPKGRVRRMRLRAPAWPGRRARGLVRAGGRARRAAARAASPAFRCGSRSGVGSRSPSTTARIREGTPAVLAISSGHGVRATFFLVGEQVERHPALAAEIAAAGPRGRRPRVPPRPAAAPHVRARSATTSRAPQDAIATATGARADALPAAVRRLQPRRPSASSRPRLAAAALVALGTRLGAAGDERVDRRPRDARPRCRRRDPPARRRPLQLGAAPGGRRRRRCRRCSTRRPRPASRS